MGEIRQCPRCGQTMAAVGDAPSAICPHCASAVDGREAKAAGRAAPDRAAAGAAGSGAPPHSGAAAAARPAAPKAAPARPRPAAAAGLPAARIPTPDSPVPGSPAQRSPVPSSPTPGSRAPSSPAVGSPGPTPPVVSPPGPVISVDPSPRAAAGRKRSADGGLQMSTRLAGLPLWQWLAGVFLAGCALSALVVYLVWPRAPQRLIVGVDQREAAGDQKHAAGGNRPAAAKPAASGRSGGSQQAKEKPAAIAADGFPRATTARNINEVMRAIVKIEIPAAADHEGAKGTGFFINDKAWIATCWHVVADAPPATQARLADGSVLPLSGIIAKAPEYDLAILKPAQWPAQLTYLDISYDLEPPLGGEVFAFGHPLNEDFVVRKGSISSLLTTNQLLDEARKNHALGAKTEFSRSMQWIRHDTAILPGNSGGPLFFNDGRVLGVNSFINVLTRSGYASHVRHLRDLATKAGDQVEPFGKSESSLVFDTEPPFSPGEIEISQKRLEELAESVVAGRADPASADEYAPWSDLARQMTFAHYTRLDSVPEPADVVASRAKAAGRAFERLIRRDYRPAQVKALGERVAEGLATPKSGVIFFGIVVADVPGLVIFQIEGTDRIVGVPNEGSTGEQSAGGRRLVVGVVAPRSLTVQGPKGMMQIPMVLSHHFGPLP